jgi:hypothetical protein
MPISSENYTAERSDGWTVPWGRHWESDMRRIAIGSAVPFLALVCQPHRTYAPWAAAGSPGAAAVQPLAHRPLGKAIELAVAARFNTRPIPPLADSAFQPPHGSPVQPVRDVILRDGLALPPQGRFGRVPVHQDVIEAALVAGKWTPPKAGDMVALPDGATRTWEPIHAGDDGVFQHRALAGGYVHIAVPADQEHVMILAAAGHALAYVNGEPRVGDGYSHGYVRVPILLRQGTNHLLFQVGRGRLSAKLLPPNAAAQFDLSDTTLPDLLVGERVDTEAAVVVLNATPSTCAA